MYSKKRNKRRYQSRTLIEVRETTETYRDHKKREKPFYRYFPTDTPFNIYTSEDQAVAAATLEHGHVQVRKDYR